MDTEQRPTVPLVAARAGVSVASVSRVLNGLPTSDAMAARVRAAAAELGYVPDAVARSLKVRRTEQLALAVDDVGNPVYVQIMRAVEAVVRAAGYRLVLSSTGSNPDEEVRIIKGVARGYADGLIISPLRITQELLAELAATRVPVVVIGSPPRGTAIDNVRADSSGGVRQAMDHLHALSHRRIAFVNGPADTVPGLVRGRAFGRAVGRLGLDGDPALRVTAADFTLAAGQAAAAELLDRGRPDAILCANDLLAIGTLHVLADRGLPCGTGAPGDIAVAGIDDTEFARVTTPTLTSVDLGATERGRRAATLLLDRIADPSCPVRRVQVPARLVVRASTLGPAAQGTAGAQESSGAQGTVGAQGTSGAEGTVGVQGTSGAEGTSGIQGTSTAHGTSTAQETSGAQEISGARGTSGAQGIASAGTTPHASSHEGGR